MVQYRESVLVAARQKDIQVLEAPQILNWEMLVGFRRMRLQQSANHPNPNGKILKLKCSLTAAITVVKNQNYQGGVRAIAKSEDQRLASIRVLKKRLVKTTSQLTLARKHD